MHEPGEIQEARAELALLLEHLSNVVGLGESMDDQGNPVIVVFVQAGADTHEVPTSIRKYAVRLMETGVAVPE